VQHNHEQQRTRRKTSPKLFFRNSENCVAHTTASVSSWRATQWRLQHVEARMLAMDRIHLRSLRVSGNCVKCVGVALLDLPWETSAVRRLLDGR